MKAKLLLAALSIAAVGTMSSCATWDEGYASSVVTVYQPPLLPPPGYYGVHVTPPMFGRPVPPPRPQPAPAPSRPPQNAPGVNRPVTLPDSKPVPSPSVRPGQGSGVHNSATGASSSGSNRPGRTGGQRTE